MIAINLLLGLLFIGIGFLVKSHPNLIAGYNTMSKEKKAKVDIQNLSIFMRNGLVTLGALVIASTLVFGLLLPCEALHNHIALYIILISCGVIMIKVQRYDHNPKSRHQTLYICLFIAAAILLMAYINFRIYIPAEMSIEGEQIEFSGNYGFTLNAADIRSMELADSIPPIKMRTHGVSSGSINKGKFRLETWGVCRLFLESGTAPFIVIIKDNDEHIIINRKNRESTEEAFQKIRELKTQEGVPQRGSNANEANDREITNYLFRIKPSTLSIVDCARRADFSV